MTTIIERPADSSAAVVLVGLLAMIVIAGLAFYYFRFYPLTAPESQKGASIDIQLNEQAPSVPVNNN